MYVVCHSEDLIEAPDGTMMACPDTRVFGTPQGAMDHLVTVDYWGQDVYPCDAEPKHCNWRPSDEPSAVPLMDYIGRFPQGKLSVPLKSFINNHRIMLSEYRPVSQSGRMLSFITIMSISSKTLENVAFTAYTLASSGIPLLIVPSEGTMVLKCLSKDRDVVNAMFQLMNRIKTSIPIEIQIEATPRNVESQFDAL